MRLPRLDHVAHRPEARADGNRANYYQAHDADNRAECLFLSPHCLAPAFGLGLQCLL